MLPQTPVDCCLGMQWAQRSRQVKAVHWLVLLLVLPPSPCLLATEIGGRMVHMWAGMWLLGEAALPLVML